MTAVDFVITNPTHHLATVEPVARRLVEAGHDCRILSLCEVRGLSSPPDNIPRVPLIRVVPRFRRVKPGSTRDPGQVRRSLKRRIARRLVWHSMVGPSLRRVLRVRRPDVVAVCNDIAYPYVPLLAILRRRSIPTVLLQEGIRFPLPVGATVEPYGTGGTTAIAAWGPASAEYLVAQGVPEKRVHVTGSPRHDAVTPEAFVAAATELRARLGGSARVAILTNPVDSQGLCRTDEKYQVVVDLAETLAPLAAEANLRLVVKPHGGEDAEAYRRLMAGTALADRVTVETSLPLYPLLAAVDGVIVLVSTVGLEALLLGASLGVLAIPGCGYLHDYVAEGVGVPVARGEELSAVRSLLAEPVAADVRRRYLDRHLAHRGAAAQRVAELMLEVAR